MLLYVIFLYVCNVVCKLASADKKFQQDQLFHRLIAVNYTADILPQCQRESVPVSINLGLREILDVSEKEEIVKLKIWVRLSWIDCKLKWNPIESGNLSKIVIPYDKIWVPDITLFEGIDSTENLPNKKEYRVLLYHNGTVHYRFPTTVQLACGMDVSLFPFDHQTCNLTFGSWIHASDEINLTRSDGDITSYLSNQEWELTDFTSTRYEAKYVCCAESFIQIVFTLEIRRKPAFYIMTLILPFVILTILSFTGFVLPPNSGEKLSFYMTILLAVIIFLLLIEEKFPSSSETFPVLGIYIMTTLILTCLSCAMSSVVLYLYYNNFEGRPLPDCFSKYLLSYLLKALCINKYESLTDGTVFDNKWKPTNIKLTSTESVDIANSDHECESGNNVNRTQSEKNNNRKPRLCRAQEKILSEWELLALILDRVFAFIYVLFTMINAFSFFIAVWI